MFKNVAFGDTENVGSCDGQATSNDPTFSFMEEKVLLSLLGWKINEVVLPLPMQLFSKAGEIINQQRNWLKPKNVNIFPKKHKQ